MDLIKNVISKWKSQWTKCDICSDMVTDSNLAIKAEEIHEEHVCNECYEQEKDLKW